ncbi:MAG: tetratricopeptide repeat protein [Deltaproteobacteria bacterium]|nr:tetratricopeptide repeat protein [Deltaproteobacteria bacterium]MBW1871007.1 tetratricopeptide repeat protein [Deltaproteobacteria bacterium]
MSPDQKDMFINPVAEARELKQNKRYAEAEKLLTQVLELNPDDRKAKASLADLYYRTNNYRKAMGLAGAIMRTDPNDPRALVVMGNVLRKKKKPKEALEYFRLALAVAETDYLWLRVASCHLDLSQPTLALSALEQAEKITANDREIFRLRAQAARLLKDDNLEQQSLRMAARAAPSQPEAFYSFVAPLLHDLPARQAIMSAEKMRQTNGQELNPHLLLFEAQMLIKNRDPENARTRLDLLLAQDPPDALRAVVIELQNKL